MSYLIKHREFQSQRYQGRQEEIQKRRISLIFYDQIKPSIKRKKITAEQQKSSGHKVHMRSEPSQSAAQKHDSTPT